jgi:hypothetical protein
MSSANMRQFKDSVSNVTGWQLSSNFIDLKKAFDSVWRLGLLYKILQNKILVQHYTTLLKICINILRLQSLSDRSKMSSANMRQFKDSVSNVTGWQLSSNISGKSFI